MSTYALVHGAGDGGWYWHLVQDDYADAVVAAVGDADELVVAGQSFGAFTAPLVAIRRPVAALVLVAGMVPAPGESPDEWWSATGYREAVRRQAERDGGLTGNDDPYVTYFHDVPRPLADEAMRRERAHPSTAACVRPWPLRAWPDVPTGVVIGTRDRCFPPELLRRLVVERLGVVPTEVGSGHCIALSRPGRLAELLLTAPGVRPRAG